MSFRRLTDSSFRVAQTFLSVPSHWQQTTSDRQERPSHPNFSSRQPRRLMIDVHRFTSRRKVLSESCSL